MAQMKRPGGSYIPYVQWRNNGVGRVGKVQGAPECKGPPSSKPKK